MPADFYDVGTLGQLAINLFNGWGYNFYRKENQLRADSLLVREKAGWLLSEARRSMETSERDFRRDKLPPLTRERNQQDPQAVEAARRIERLAQELSDLIGLIAAQPAPENDRINQRHRREVATLEQLLTSDRKLVGQAETLRLLVAQKDGTWLVTNAEEIRKGFVAIRQTLDERTRCLQIPG